MQCIFLDINQPEILHLHIYIIDNTWRQIIRPSNFEESLEITQILRSERLLKNELWKQQT